MIREPFQILIAGLTLILTLAGCSRELLPESEGGRNTLTSADETFNAKGEAYIRVNVQLPEMSGSVSRATDDATDHGLPDESLISPSNSYLVLFSGTTPASAKARSVYPLSDLQISNAATLAGGMTRSGTVTLGITRAGMSDGEKVYALLIANAPLYGSNITFYFTYTRPPLEPGGERDPRKAVFGVVFYNETGRIERTIVNNNVNNGEGNSTFELMMNMIVSYHQGAGPYQPRNTETDRHPLISKLDDEGNRRYIFMSNAPMMYRPVTSDDYTMQDDGAYTLAEVDVNHIHKTKAGAENDQTPALNVFLERIVAKVTVGVNQHPTNTVGTWNGTQSFGFELDSWQLLNAARTAYCGHNLNIPIADNGGKADMEYVNPRNINPQGYAVNWIRYASNGTTPAVYRFVSGTPVMSGVDRYRINWEITPGYIGDKAGMLFSGSTSEDVYEKAKASPDEALYPLPNTFNVANMRQRTTTGAIFKVRITAPGDNSTNEEIRDYGLYSISSDPGKYLTYDQMLDKVFDMLCTRENLYRLAEDIATSNSGLQPTNADWLEHWRILFKAFYTNGQRVTPTSSYRLDSLARFLNDAKLSFFPQGEFSGDITGEQWLKPDNAIGTPVLNYYLATPDVWGHDFVHTISDYTNAEHQDGTGEEYNDAYVILCAYITNSIAYLKRQTADVPLVTFYKGGWAYYRTLIRHFNEVQTPWNNGETPAIFTPVGDLPPTPVTYPLPQDTPEAENRQGANYLGRYGIVRNTWYRLTIDGLNGTGSIAPEPFTSTKTDDDIQQNLYIRMVAAPWVRPDLQDISF